jgi:hypothetical protein
MWRENTVFGPSRLAAFSFVGTAFATAFSNFGGAGFVSRSPRFDERGSCKNWNPPGFFEDCGRLQ